MGELNFKLIKNENAELSNNEIVLTNAFSCTLCLQILEDKKLTNNFEVIYDNDNSWITVKKNFIDINDETHSNFNIYIDDNYTNQERYYYLSLRNNFNGEISTLIIKQPACNFRIDISPNEISFIENNKNEEQTVNIIIYGGEKIGLVGSKYIDIRTKIIVIEGVEFPVINNQVSINGKDYTVVDGKVNIPTEFIVINAKIKIDDTEYDQYIEIDKDKYGVNNAKITINGIEYDQYVTIDEVNYGVKDGKVNIPIEYEVRDNFIDYDNSLSFNMKEIKTYIVKDGKVTIGGKEYTVTDVKITINGIKYDKYVTVEVDYGIKESKITINGIAYDQYVTVNGVNYGVKDGKVTINGIEYEIKDVKITINGIKYDKYVTVGVNYAVEDNKVINTNIFNEYQLSLKFMGDFSDNKEYHYEFPIIHKNNVETKQILKININNVADISTDGLLNNINNVFNTQNQYFNNTIKNRNESNLNEELEESTKKISKRIKKKTKILKEIDSIDDISIIGNQIILQTNVYNHEDIIEHNSALLIQSKAIWCHTTNFFNKENNLHYINVNCDNNFWGIERKTLLIVRNAEDVNYYNKKIFKIKQDINNNITIEEKKD